MGVGKGAKRASKQTAENPAATLESVGTRANQQRSAGGATVSAFGSEVPLRRRAAARLALRHPVTGARELAQSAITSTQTDDCGAGARKPHLEHTHAHTNHYSRCLTHSSQQRHAATPQGQGPPPARRARAARASS